VKFKVTAIGNNAFKSQKKATSLVVGKNVQVIGKNAFYGDSKLKTITLKTSSLKKVGAKAFKGIYKKAVIKVPKNKVKSYTKLMKNKGQAKTVKIKK
ncbi:Leucine rich repeat-containing protein, partial [Acetitomaculum ruminis DSM 5522]